jgi:hypothetical protein
MPKPTCVHKRITRLPCTKGLLSYHAQKDYSATMHKRITRLPCTKGLLGYHAQKEYSVTMHKRSTRLPCVKMRCGSALASDGSPVVVGTKQKAARLSGCGTTERPGMSDVGKGDVGKGEVGKGDVGNGDVGKVT